MNRKQRRQLKRNSNRKSSGNQPGVFGYNGYIYSVSQKNAYGEYIVIKMHQHPETGVTKIIDTRVIKARNVIEVRKDIEKYSFDTFKKFDKNSLH